MMNWLHRKLFPRHARRIEKLCEDVISSIGELVVTKDRLYKTEKILVDTRRERDKALEDANHDIATRRWKNRQRSFDCLMDDLDDEAWEIFRVTAMRNEGARLYRRLEELSPIPIGYRDYVSMQEKPYQCRELTLGIVLQISDMDGKVPSRVLAEAICRKMRNFFGRDADLDTMTAKIEEALA